jgi:hypothetical protein
VSVQWIDTRPDARPDTHPDTRYDFKYFYKPVPKRLTAPLVDAQGPRTSDPQPLAAWEDDQHSQPGSYANHERRRTMNNARQPGFGHRRSDLDRAIDTAGWGLFFIWAGLAVLANLGLSAGVLGVGVLMVGNQVARRYAELKVRWFAVILGLCLALGGLSRIYNLHQGRPLLPEWLVPGLFIAAGVAILAKIWRH